MVNITFDIILPSILRPTLYQTIQSVQAQTHRNWRLIVMSSTGEFPNITLDDERIEFHKLPQPVMNDWGTKARNTAIALCNNTWITYIDDDDQWLPHHLTTFHRLINNWQDVSVFSTVGQAIRWKGAGKRRELVPMERSVDILTVGLCHTREIFAKTSGWQSHDGHDRTLWEEMLKAGGKNIRTDTTTFYFLRGKK